jgi:hypothetical protein
MPHDRVLVIARIRRARALPHVCVVVEWRPDRRTNGRRVWAAVQHVWNCVFQWAAVACTAGVQTCAAFLRGGRARAWRLRLETHECGVWGRGDAVGIVGAEGAAAMVTWWWMGREVVWDVCVGAEGEGTVWMQVGLLLVLL